MSKPNRSTGDQVLSGLQVALCVGFGAWDVHGLNEAFKAAKAEKAVAAEKNAAAQKTASGHETIQAAHAGAKPHSALRPFKA